ncbi:zinc finger protein 664 isoform X2 [Ovis canadensis]|uniref:zinc finger protein 664 isoform X2 n=1 Tax=Ovis canadensis TaxID=37174 RepID=UPI0037534362
MGGAAGGAGSWLRPCPGRAAEGGQWAPPAERISPAPTRALAAVHAGSGGPGRREGLAALTRRADEAPARRRRRRRRRRSASRPSRASGASYSGDEEPSGHPAQIAAAAGRLHCLTITRAGFSPRIPRLLLPFSHCGP